MKRKRILVLVIGLLSLGVSHSQDLLDFLDNEIVDTFGLTAYGEPCTDQCTNRGFSYAWCHKNPSRNGTWIDRDYCSPNPGFTRYGSRCLDSCKRKNGQPFFTCATTVTKRGDWDYCSPFPSDLVCAWSQWGPWSQCSDQCGTKSTKTRRRRMEQVGTSGRVGRCSGEIEQSIKSCNGPPCPDAKPFDCVWGAWTRWTPCSVTCGGGGTQSRKRGIATPPSRDGAPCSVEDAKQTILCSRVEECPEEPTTTQDPVVLEDSSSSQDLEEEEESKEKEYLGSFTNYFHGVRGEIFSMGSRHLLIDGFRYDGTGPDAFFWVGTRGSRPSDDGLLLAHPFRGKFYDYQDSDAPVLKRFTGQVPIVLTLPQNITVSDLKWISVWCRQFSINFGDFVFDDDENEDPQPFETTTEQQQIETTTATKIFRLGGLPESPRSVASNGNKSGQTSNGFLLKSKIEEIRQKGKLGKDSKTEDDENNDQNEAESESEDLKPFTVVRVSSSVSQIRPKLPKIPILTTTTEETTEATTTTEPQTTLSSTKSPKKARPPFLRPIAKFPDIKIPALDRNRSKKPKPKIIENEEETTEKIITEEPEVEFEQKLRISNLFNRTLLRPSNAIFRRTSTTTTSTTTITTTGTTTSTTVSTTSAPIEFSTTSSILEQIGIDKPLKDPGVSNFARIPLTKFQMSSQNPSENVPTPEAVTFAPDTVTISAVNNEGATRILEVVKIVKPTEEEPKDEEPRRIELESTDEDSEPKETIEAKNKNGATRLLEVLEIKRPKGFVPAKDVKISTTEKSVIVTENSEISSTVETTESVTQSTRRRLPFPTRNPDSVTESSVDQTTRRRLPFPTRRRRPFGSRQTTTSTTQEILESTTVDNSDTEPESSTRRRLPIPQRDSPTRVPTFRRPSLPRVLPTRTTISASRSTTTEFLPTVELSDPEDPDEEVETTESSLDEEITVKPTPEEIERKQNGRAGSRFKGLNRISLLFPKRKPFVPFNRGRSTETPFTTSREDITLAGFGSRSTEFPLTTPTTRAPALTTTENAILSLFRSRGTRRPFKPRVRTTRAPISILARSTTEKPALSGSTFTLNPPSTAESSEEFFARSTTIRPTEDERADSMEKLMKDEKKNELITQFYPDPDYEEFESEVKTPPKKVFSPKFRATTSIPDFDTDDDDDDGTKAISVSTRPLTTPITPIPSVVLISTPSSGRSGYDPCAIPDSCGPNAICTTRNSDPVCSCPSGFSGIPRDGNPDPSHGCVRTPQKCTSSPNCPIGQSCIRELCLPDCSTDAQCALGERCVNSTCTKICFYDAHCLAGEFCEKEDDVPGSNGVCLAGCRRDTNCPFGQICLLDDTTNRGRCQNGCHFNNDCTMGTACINGNCTDPCHNFDECGANAICETVSHSPTCKCPEGTRELNSPYVACVPAEMDLSAISCLRDSDCSFGLTCQDWQCRPAG